jgi:hypothetical protein
MQFVTKKNILKTTPSGGSANRPFLGYVWEDASVNNPDRHATRLLVDVAGFVIGMQSAVSFIKHQYFYDFA